MNKLINTVPTLLALSVVAALNPVSAEESNVDHNHIEVIEVTGLRASYIKSTDIKRDSNQVVDVITAEDVGKFPDNDVLESMQRITGVQISRGESGTADGFSIRGISQNRVELNGRTVSGGEGEGRGVNLSDIPSELIAGLEVIKSPTADMIEGSLGATVNLKTARPLSFKKDLNKLTVKGKYSDNIDEYYGNYNAVVSRKWELDNLGEFGALINITHNNNQAAGDVYRLNGWGNRCGAYKLNGAGNNVVNVGNANCPEDAAYFAPNSIVQLQYEEEQTRSSVTTTFQWRPDDSSEYILDLSYLNKEDLQSRDTLVFNPQQLNNILSVDEFNARQVDGIYNSVNFQNNPYEIERYDAFGQLNDVVTPVTYLQSDAARINNSNAQGQTQVNERFTFGLVAKWTVGDNWFIESEIGYSESDYERHYTAGQLQTWRANQVNWVDAGEAIAPNSYDQLTLDITDSTLVNNAWVGHELTDPRYYRLNFIQDDGWNHKPKEGSFRIDFDYALDMEILESIEFGFRTTENIMERTERFRFRCNHTNANFDPQTDSRCEDRSASVVDLDNEFPEMFDNVDGFYDQVASGVNPWLQLNPKLFLDDRTQWREIHGFQGYETFPNEYYKLTEKTNAAYAKINFFGELAGNWEYRGNAGIRYVETDIESITTPGANPESISTFVNKNNYDNVLPSINVAFSNDDLIIRFAAASVMVRPSFDQLKPTGNFNFIGTDCSVYNSSDPYNEQGRSNDPSDWPDSNVNADEQQLQIAQAEYLSSDEWNGFIPCPGIRNSSSIGNLNLDPYTANTLDLSFEHYWGEGNSASLTFFYRDVEADLVSARDIIDLPVDTDLQVDDSLLLGQERWRTNKPVNGGGSTREGIELSYTQFFDFLPEGFDGLGISLNYTYSDGDRPDPVLIDQSRNVLNLSGSYEEQLTQAEALVTNGDISSFDLLDRNAFSPVADLSKDTFNGSVFYDKEKVNVRLSYNYRSSYHTGGNGPSARYRDGESRVDFSSSYEFSKALSVNFNINNLTRTESHFYLVDSAITQELRYTDRTFTLGIGYKF